MDNVHIVFNTDTAPKYQVPVLMLIINDECVVVVRALNSFYHFRIIFGLLAVAVFLESTT